MALKLYNSLTRSEEEFVSHTPDAVKMYTCGPTVYNYCHIGNLRAYLFADLLRRYLEYSGYAVEMVMNITDVGHLTQEDIDSGEDKMEVAAARENKSIWDIAAFYTEAFLKDLKTLNILEPKILSKATEHIPDMIEQIEALIKTGHAYVVEGEVYYDVSSFDTYGQLSNNNLEDLVAGARIAINEKKKSPADFALWKHDDKHLMQWDSPWGKGFPGWHIECSAMGMKYLGEQLDIHTGGEDLIFPHHSCEIAQAEGVTGKKFVKYWLHNRYLLVDGQKMSKSLNNFFILDDILKKGYSARAFRYLITSIGFNQNLNFTFDSLQAAEEALKRIDEFVASMKEAADAKDNPLNIEPIAGAEFSVTQAIETMKTSLKECMDTNLNASGATGALFQFIKEINRKGSIGASNANACLNSLREIDHVFGFIQVDQNVTIELSDSDLQLIGDREKARANKDWAKSDEIRDHFLSQGIILVDKAEGTVWKKDPSKT